MPILSNANGVTIRGTKGGGKLKRREFIQLAGSFAGCVGVLPAGQTEHARIALIVDPADVVAGAGPSRWAAAELEHALGAAGVAVHRYERLSQASAGDLSIVAAGSQSRLAAGILKQGAETLNQSAGNLKQGAEVLKQGGEILKQGPAGNSGQAGTGLAESGEALGLVPANLQGRKVLLACGTGARGLVYALLELADRVQNAADPFSALALQAPVIERPSNAVRGLMRLFASDVEDKPWFNDREMWPRYLTMLATQRFNRFNLSLSLGYDFLRRVTDAYFLFPYPFLLSVPGYNVKARPLGEAERDRNLEMLRFISEQTVARGLQFQLGLWMHGYEWIDSPGANYTIEGLTHETHGPYCRDALRLLLQACPAIAGVTLRTHGESGVEEGSYEFWQTVFEGVATCGRRVEIDLHPKGLDQTMLDNAIRTRQPITVSPKFWAEHLGMPYHQADIRDIEVPKAGKQTSRLMNLSEGSRSFMRYGYGDLLREDRSFRMIHRIWPGSQRLLLWGDPVAGAAYSRAFGFCGSEGAELMEPLTFKGRRGSGVAGNRTAYADARLRPRWDWQKYEYSYRVWGRLLYNADSDPDPWRRYLRKHFGQGAGDLESALASANRILPIVTTAHLPSAANNNYWPEMYLNQSLIDAAHPGSYSDTPAPKVFGNVSPLDPQLFSRINDFADELLRGAASGKYSPLDAGRWLDEFADGAHKHLAQAASRIAAKQDPDYVRFAADVSIQAGLGRFFAAKFRSGVLFRIFEKTGEAAAGEAALGQYRAARAAWAEFSERARGVYVDDVTVGELPQLHGHWSDRLPAIDRDINLVAEKLAGAKPGQPSASVAAIIKEVLAGGKPRDVLTYRHTPTSFVHGKPLEIGVNFDKPVVWVNLYYRRVNQAERLIVVAMENREGRYQSTIPGPYTDSAYPLQYYFEVKTIAGRTQICPGFSRDLTNQPYIVIRSRVEGAGR
jgi:hypothetical protein